MTEGHSRFREANSGGKAVMSLGYFGRRLPLCVSALNPGREKRRKGRKGLRREKLKLRH